MGAKDNLSICKTGKSSPWVCIASVVNPIIPDRVWKIVFAFLAYFSSDLSSQTTGGSATSARLSSTPAASLLKRVNNSGCRPSPRVAAMVWSERNGGKLVFLVTF